MNPIENNWAEVKAQRRRHRCDDIDELLKSMLHDDFTRLQLYIISEYSLMRSERHNTYNKLKNSLHREGIFPKMRIVVSSLFFNKKISWHADFLSLSKRSLTLF